MLSFKAQLTYYSLRALSGILSRVSDHTACTLGQQLGALIFYHFPLRNKEAKKNLMKAFPDHSEYFYTQILKRSHQHFGGIFMDALRLSTFNFKKNLIVKNREVLDHALTAGKGVILLSGHFGNWEMIPVWFARNGYQFYTVVKRQKNRGANKFFMEIRRKMRTHPLYSGSQAQMMLHILREGGIIGLASDQDARQKGVFVNFFGIPSSTHRGAAILHLKTGAPMVMALCQKDSDNKYHLNFFNINTASINKDSVKTITQKFTSILENEVKTRPEQYFWFHRRWKTKLKTDFQQTHENL